MRKMKKINGYLVVKFNARELREYEGTALGEYGVIDAELYTGILDVDRGAMEYDNAGSMEEAVELARGLESELDAEEPEVKVTIVKETDETTEEEEVDAQQKALIQNIWFDRRFAANLGTIEMLYEKFEEVAEGRGWENYPSIKTVARYIKHLMDSRGGESARYLAANGSREWKNKKMLKGKRDATSLKVMEYVVGDEHTFDFWVQWVAPNGKIKAVRPKLVACRESEGRVRRRRGEPRGDEGTDRAARRRPCCRL